MRNCHSRPPTGCDPEARDLPDPIIVKLIEPPGDPTGLSEVLIGALGLTGVIVVIALVSSIILAGLLFWFRSRST